MLVVEDGRSATTRFEYFDRLFEEFVAWIKRLTQFILRIVAMLANDHDSIHRELASA